jgi:VanZ family protein
MLVLCSILTLGLWPFHRPRNEVSWLANENGIRFVGRSTIFSFGTFRMEGPPDEASCTLEVWLQPEHTRASNTFLSFYTPENPLQFSLHQYLSYLILERRTSSSQHKASVIGIDSVFDQNKPVFITITSGVQETTMYANGKLVRTFPGFRLRKDFTGQMLISNSPLEADGWTGQLRGLAIYYRELIPAQVIRHYETWTTQGAPEMLGNEGLNALYVFNEHAGRVVHNSVRPGIDLYIPERFSLLHQVFLKPFWREYKSGWDYYRDVLMNVLGFVPLGFFSYAYWRLARPIKSPALVTMILGLAISLTIEIGQSYLPTRSSGTTDLITNTFGTFLGVRLYSSETIRTLFARVLEKLPNLSRPIRLSETSLRK